MGMTDKQFDSYKQSLLRDLRRISIEIEKDGKSAALEELVRDLENELNRP